MKLFPSKVKYRKRQVGRKNAAKLATRVATRGNRVTYGDYGIKALSQARIASNQIEAARKVASRTVGKTGKVYITVFPDRPVTRKPSEVGMGKGKGDLDHYVVEVFPGRVMFEVAGVTEEVAREAMRKAGTKLAVKTKFVKREILK